MKLVLLLFLSGIVTGVPFVFPDLSFLGYVSLLPLALLLFSKGRDAKIRQVLLWGLAWGMGFFLVIYHWFLAMYPLEFLSFTRGEAALAVAVCWILLSLLETAHFLIVPLGYRLVRPSVAWTKPVVLAALWVLFEWAQTLTWMGVPWNKLALGQYTDRVALQTISLFGSYGLAAVLVLVNGFLALALLTPTDRKQLVRYGALALGILTLNHGVGAALLLSHRNEGETVRVAAIQANIGSTDKWVGTNLTVVRKYVALTADAAAAGAKLVLWPETVVTSALTAEKRALITECAQTCNVTILGGSFAYETNEAGETETYNAMFVAYPDGTIGDVRYDKQKLVPFGEYLPMQTFIETFLPVLAGMNVLGSDLSAGETATTIPTAFGSVGGMICYDSIYEDVALKSVRNGAALLALITNDSWYLDSAAVWQHNGDSVLRAVEQGRWVVSAASTGISAVISPTGEIVDMAEPLTADIVYGDVTFETGRTLYSSIGNLAVAVAGVLLIAVFFTEIYLKKQQKDDDVSVN